MKPLILLAFVCCCLPYRHGHAAPMMEQHRMTFTKANKEDLDSSATGYVYNQQQGLPVYYVQYTDHGSGPYYRAADSLQYVVGSPVAHGVPEPTTTVLLPYATAEDVQRQGAVNYGNDRSLEHVDTPRAPYYAAGKINADEEESENDGTYGKTVVEDEDESEEMDDNEGADDHDGRENHAGYDGSAVGHGGYGNSGNGDSKYEAGKGESHTAEGYSVHGEKGDKGYNKEDKYSKGESGNEETEHREGYYKENGGRDKGYVDEAEEHGSHEEGEKSVKGGNYGQSSYHKKGHKTKGFHNVYHKDEYKKETDFYDDDHKKGHFAEYEKYDKGHENEEGGFKKGGHHSDGHDYQAHGEKGRYDKGHRDSKDQGHVAEEGEKSYYSNHEDYGAEKGSKSARAHKFSKGDR